MAKSLDALVSQLDNLDGRVVTILVRGAQTKQVSDKAARLRALQWRGAN